jgi:hypothetical protein
MTIDNKAGIYIGNPRRLRLSIISLY